MNYLPETGKITPGPWTAELDGANGNTYWRCFKINAGERLVAELDCSNGLGQGDANAAVFAAAREMLDVLERVKYWMACLPTDAQLDRAGMGASLTGRQIYGQIAAVIARARSANPVQA
jgi:hypothetical protein